jgi:hypothetical protein
MSLQVQEITNFKSGIDLSLDPILAPADAFVNLTNGYVHRGVLRSRKGLSGFATGTDEDNRLVSRVSNEITNEDLGLGGGGPDYTLNLANDQIERGQNVVVTAAAQSITFTWVPDTRQTTTSGDDGGASTNSVNYDTGVVNVSFTAGVGGATTIFVSYHYHPDLPIMGIHEYIRTPTPRDLIVCDEDFPYIYDGTNNDFDRIPFNGVLGPFTGGSSNFFTFQNWRLHSRGAVPAAAGPLTLLDRLFLTNNVDAPFVYNGTDMNLVSAMPEFRQPAEGALNRALHVIAYGERLIWLRPRLGGQDFAQGVLWGPINDSDGLALDYQATGSGILSAATDSIITGIHFLRDTLIVFFESDVYALELTDDAFRPFRWTKLEDERGVEPTHGATGFLGTVESPGRFGVLGTDGRRTNRVDDRIPFFTREEIDPLLITHVYGEEMERDSQFWWTYPAEDDIDLTTANKVLVKNFEEENYSIYDLSLSTFNRTIQGNNTVWDNLAYSFADSESIPTVVDDVAPPAGPNDITVFDHPIAKVTWDEWGYEEERYKMLAGDHHGFIFTVGKSYSDNSVLITPQVSTGTLAITTGSSTTIETEFHNFQVNDVVSIANVQGMIQINGLLATITSVPDHSSIIVNIDSQNFDAWTAGGEITKLIKFEAESVPFNPFRGQGQSCYIGKMDFLVKSGTGEYEIDFFDDRNSDTWTVPQKTFTFSSGDDEGLDRWFSIYVDHTADFHRWRIKQDQINEQIAIKSIRIFFRAAGESNV